MLKPKVLLVEDDLKIQKAMKMQFQDSGFLVKTALDGVEAIDTLKKWTPSAVILDILMPKKNGFDVLAEIKSNPDWKGIPVLIASNLGQEKDISKGINMSAAEYIVKSNLSLEDLIKKTLYLIKMSDHGKKTLGLN